MNEGKMIDASFTIAPRQRNTHDENKTIKENKGVNFGIINQTKRIK
jgi:hypothetical protein